MNPLSLFGSVFSSGAGLFNLIRGISMNPELPQYQIPQEVTDQLAMSENELNAGMPGYSQYLSNINQNQANTTGELERGAGSSSNFLSGLMSIQGNTNKGFQNLSLMQGQSYQQRLENLNRAQELMAQQKAAQWQYNKYMPYMRDLQRKYDLIGGGLNTLVGSADQASQAGMMNQMMKQPENVSQLPYLQSLEMNAGGIGDLGSAGLAPMGMSGLGMSMPGIPAGLAAYAAF